MSNSQDKILERCQERLGYRFNNPSWLKKALTHASSKGPEHPSNERLEFLGDAILGMVVSDYLFREYPKRDEGELTKIKSVAVSTRILSEMSSDMGLQEDSFLGKGMQKADSLPKSLLANLFEAVTAAIYLDGGIDAARQFVLGNLNGAFEEILNNQHPRNYKSILQHYAQRELNFTPTYRVIREEGPDHVKSFEVAVVIGTEEHHSGVGRSKKEAEQKAARATLYKILGPEWEQQPTTLKG